MRTISFPWGRSVAGYAFSKNAGSFLYLSMKSSDIELSNHVSRTRVSPIHFSFAKSLNVPIFLPFL